MAGVAGVEPTSAVLETVILPLNYTPKKVGNFIITQKSIWSTFSYVIISIGDNMELLDTLLDISYYKVGLILKVILTIIFTVVPIMIIILSMTDIYKIVVHPEEVKKPLATVASRIIAGLIIFLIPSLVSYVFTFIEGYDENFLFKYYNEATPEKIKSLEEQYQKELLAEKTKTYAENIEKINKRNEDIRKRNDQLEEMREEERQRQQQQSSSGGGGSGGSGSSGSSGEPYTGDTVSSGTYGGVTVNNGVFTIPNRRATSDADTPKQSGEYGLNPIFWERLNKFMQAANAQGYKITVTSAWRPYSKQKSLWDSSSRACSERSKWVACPGGSRHGFGIAADLAFNGSSCSGGWDCNAAAKWAHANAGNYGLKFRMSWEPWHIEPDQVNGGSFGSCNVPC